MGASPYYAPPPPPLNVIYAAPPPPHGGYYAATPAQSAAAAESLIESIATYERVSCVLWLILGIGQVCVGLAFMGVATWALVAGGWNIYAVITRWSLPGMIKRRDPSVPSCYEGIVGLIIIGLINLVFGGVIGVAFVIFDFYVRGKVMSNAHLFNDGSYQDYL